MIGSLVKIFPDEQVCFKGIMGLVRCGEGIEYLMSPWRPTDIGFQLGNACYPCSREG